MNKARILPAASALASALPLAFLLGACALLSSPSSPEASIASFSLAKSDNPVLSTDVTGIIDTRAKTVKLRIDSSVTDFSALKPAIVLSGSADVYPASGEAKDFTQTPVTYKLVEASGRTIVYYVTIVPKTVEAEAGALRITEYFCGTGTGTGSTGELNRYIELYNGSDSAVDLSQFELAQRRSRNGLRNPALDQVATLKGSIGAKSFHIIYSARMNGSLLASANAFASKQSDAAYNAIMDSDGASGYQLLKDGVVLDAIGPNDGSFYATSSCYYRRSDTTTGIPLAASASWDRRAWASAPIGGLLGDDANAGKASLTSTSLISLLLSKGSLKIPATIDNTAKVATILMPDGVDTSSLAIAVGSYGVSAKIDGTAISNGATTIDFSSGTRLLTIEGQDGTTTQYSVSAIPRYTAVNYDFDGGIKAVVDKIWAGGSFDTSLGDVYITGVVTAKSIYPAAFVIQDKNAGIYFYTSEGISFPVGAKVKIMVSTGKVYYGLPEVTAYDSAIEAAGASLYSIYYKTGDYATSAGIGSVYRYEGSIAQGGLSYYKGQFTGSQYFHYPTDIQSALSAGSSGVFYGPVSYTRDNYTMELVTRDQFSIR